MHMCTQTLNRIFSLLVSINLVYCVAMVTKLDFVMVFITACVHITTTCNSISLTFGYKNIACIYVIHMVCVSKLWNMNTMYGFYSASLSYMYTYTYIHCVVDQCNSMG